MAGNYGIRELDPAERFIWLLDRISCANFVLMGELQGHPISEEVLRRGLDKLQANHPLLCATVQEGENGKMGFYREEGARLPLMVEERSEQDWQQAVEAVFSDRFDEPGQPMARCLMLNLPRRSIIVLAFHHAIGDGLSGIERLKELLRFCLRGVEKAPEKTAPPPLHALFPPQFQWQNHPQKAAELGQQMMADFVRHGPPDEMPFLDHKEPRREPRLRQIRLEPTLGRLLAERCRAEGTSMLGAVAAAELIATRNLFETEDPRTLYLMCPVNMRSYVVGDIGDGLSYCTSFLRSTYRIDAATDFWPLARYIVTDFRERLERGDAHLIYSMLPLDQIPASGPAFDAFVAGMEQLPAGSNISNLGRIEPVENCPEVEAITGALCSLPKHLTSLNVSGYNDELVINMTYDGAKLAPDLVDRLANDLEALLTRSATATAAIA